MIRKIFIYHQPLTEILEINDDETIHRLKNVLRLKPGDKIWFLNDLEEIAEYEVQDSKKWILKRLNYSLRNLEPQRKINLYVSLIRKEKFELILEKGTELGVYHFYPVISDRSSIKIKTLPSRWFKIIGSAMEVVNWKHTPHLHSPIFLSELLKEDLENFYTAHPEGELINPKDLPHTLNLLIGPEGGLAKENLSFLRKKQALFHWGKRL